MTYEKHIVQAIENKYGPKPAIEHVSPQAPESKEVTCKLLIYLHLQRQNGGTKLGRNAIRGKLFNPNELYVNS